MQSVTVARLRPLSAAARIAAVADPGSVAAVDEALAGPRPSRHLARWGLRTQDDDGVVLVRATIQGAPVFVAAQDECFLGGSAGTRHAEALRTLFDLARGERPEGVVLLMASGGVRLHEANPAELMLARALARLLDLRAAGVSVLSVGVGDVFGGASVLACAADEIALLPGMRLGLSGPRVIEATHGKGELAADNVAAVEALFGAEARARAGQVALVADDATTVKAWIVSTLGQREPFADRIAHAHGRLAKRLEAIPSTAVPQSPIPPALEILFAAATALDSEELLWKLRERPVWITRPPGAGTFGPRFAHGVDAALLAHLVNRTESARRTLFVVCDSAGHDSTSAAESLCVSQYLAQHAAVLALLRASGVQIIGLLAGNGHSAAFFANALQAPQVFALEHARVVAMEAAAIARVTGLDGGTLAARIDDDPLVGHAVRHFAGWGGVAGILPDAYPGRLVALAERQP